MPPAKVPGASRGRTRDRLRAGQPRTLKNLFINCEAVFLARQSPMSVASFAEAAKIAAKSGRKALQSTLDALSLKVCFVRVTKCCAFHTFIKFCSLGEPRFFSISNTTHLHCELRNEGASHQNAFSLPLCTAFSRRPFSISWSLIFCVSQFSNSSRCVRRRFPLSRRNTKSRATGNGKCL